MKNFLATVLLALGTPMLLMGDEVRRTQRGNNNAYCLDDDTTWLDWNLLDRHDGVRRFVHLLIRDGPAARHLTARMGDDWGPSSHTLAATVLRSLVVLMATVNSPDGRPILDRDRR